MNKSSMINFQINTSEIINLKVFLLKTTRKNCEDRMLNSKYIHVHIGKLSNVWFLINNVFVYIDPPILVT